MRTSRSLGTHRSPRISALPDHGCGSARNAHLARDVFHGRKGLLRQAYQEGMEDQLGALGLVLNCVTLWNTVYLDAAISALRADGYPVRDEDVSRLSLYVRRHLNVDGHYSFALPDLAGARRALRDPDSPDDDD